MVEDNGAVRRASAGRPRDEQIDAAVIAATLEMLGAEGYAGVSLEGVARRAGTSRPAIYRRWAGRAPLVLAALARHLDVPTPSDTGCTLCDVDESFQVFLGAYTTIRPEDLSALYADCAHDADWRSAYLGAIIEPARFAVATMIDRATSRSPRRERRSRSCSREPPRTTTRSCSAARRSSASSSGPSGESTCTGRTRDLPTMTPGQVPGRSWAPAYARATARPE